MGSGVIVVCDVCGVWRDCEEQLARAREQKGRLSQSGPFAVNSRKCFWREKGSRRGVDGSELFGAVSTNFDDSFCM